MASKMQRQIPQAGQESVWDYPRPPRVEPVIERIRVIFAGETIADSTRAFRVLETSHPPSYYIPPADIRMDLLTATRERSVCEFKGAANYWTISVNGQTSDNAAWRYAQPLKGYEAIIDHLAFYANRVDEAWVGDAKVQPQAGDFYGGWITDKVVGPFKGAPGTWGW